VFQFLKIAGFLEIFPANYTAHQLDVATGMMPFYQIVSYCAGYIKTSISNSFLNLYSNGKRVAIVVYQNVVTKSYSRSGKLILWTLNFSKL
jgi:hypothetical protein